MFTLVTHATKPMRKTIQLSWNLNCIISRHHTQGQELWVHTSQQLSLSSSITPFLVLKKNMWVLFIWSFIKVFHFFVTCLVKISNLIVWNGLVHFEANVLFCVVHCSPPINIINIRHVTILIWYLVTFPTKKIPVWKLGFYITQSLQKVVST